MLKMDKRHFITIYIIIILIKNGEKLQRMHMRANVVISAQLSMAKSFSLLSLALALHLQLHCDVAIATM